MIRSMRPLHTLASHQHLCAAAFDPPQKIARVVIVGALLLDQDVSSFVLPGEFRSIIESHRNSELVPRLKLIGDSTPPYRHLWKAGDGERSSSAAPAPNFFRIQHQVLRPLDVAMLDVVGG